MTLEEFLQLLAEQQATRPPGWGLDGRRRLRDAECRCPVESVAYYVLGIQSHVPFAFTVRRNLGLEVDVFTAIVTAADHTDFATRQLRQTMLAICQAEAA